MVATFAVFPVQGHCGLRRLKRYFGNKMPVGAQMVIVLKAIVEHCVPLVLGHPFEFSWLDVYLFWGTLGHADDLNKTSYESIWQTADR